MPGNIFTKIFQDAPGNFTGYNVLSIHDTYADMVSEVLLPIEDGLYGVRTTTGILLINRKRKGIWRYNGVSFEWFSEFEKEFLDSEIKIYNQTDTSKAIQFDASAITTGNTRTLTMADRDYDLTYPEINYLNFVSITPPSYGEGLLFYDSTEKTLSLYNDKPSISLPVGRRLWVRSCNKTAANILKGSVVYIVSHIGTCPEIALARPEEFSLSRVIGVATDDILIDEEGEVTYFGMVKNLNTSLLSSGIVYLDTDGGLTNERPAGALFPVIIGNVLVSDVTDGILLVNISLSDMTVEVNDINGFSNRTNTILSFSDVAPDRTFSISPAGTMFNYYIAGKVYHKYATDSIQLPAEEGLYAIYYDEDTLSTIINPTEAQIENLLRTKCLVTYIYWDATNLEHSYFADERHGISMSPLTHTYLHFTRGAQFLQGLGIGDLITDGNGNDNTHAQFSVGSGRTADEDLSLSFSAIGSTTGLPIYYLLGSAGNMRRILNTGFSVLDDISAGVDITGRLVWNEWTGSTWQLSVVTNNGYVLCHVFAVNGYAGEDQQIAIIGQNSYGLLADAKIGAASEIGSILTGFLFEEIVPVATIIFQTGNTYTNAVKARVRPPDVGNYVDWRTTELAQGANPSSHSNLTDLSEDTHLQYFNLSGRAGGTVGYGSTLAGEDLTFNSTSHATKGTVNIQPDGGSTIFGGDIQANNLFLDQTDTAGNPIALEIDNAGSGDSINVNDEILIDSDSNLKLDFDKKIIFGLTTITPYLWYDYNETTGTGLPDISGNGRNGTTVNGPTWISGKLNNCLNFNGTTQYVDCGNVAGFETDSAFSIDTWVYKNATGGGVLVSKRTGGNIGWSLHYVSSNQFHLFLGDGTVNLLSRTLANFAIQTWHHIVVTYDGSNTYAGINFYVNGSSEATENLSTGLPSTILNVANLNLARYAGGGYFNGRLDETLILSEVVDSTYISNRYNSGVGTETFPGTASTGYFINTGGKLFLNFGGNTKQFVFNPGGRLGIGTDIPDGVIDVTPDTILTDSYSYPFPRVTTTQKNAMTGMSAGAHVYDTDLDQVFFFNGSIWTLAY